jgi:transcriptional regulator with XRE-family HTH domain
MSFGKILRELRTGAGMGIKKLGPQLGVNYTYLSKLENNEVSPSEDFVEKVAQYFHYNRDQLLLSAGKVPDDILQILRDHPEGAVELLRERFSRRRRG